MNDGRPRARASAAIEAMPPSTATAPEVGIGPEVGGAPNEPTPPAPMIRDGPAACWTPASNEAAGSTDGVEATRAARACRIWAARLDGSAAVERDARAARIWAASSVGDWDCVGRVLMVYSQA
jgi:hypothetical protein